MVYPFFRWPSSYKDGGFDIRKKEVGPKMRVLGGPLSCWYDDVKHHRQENHGLEGYALVVKTVSTASAREKAPGGGQPTESVGCTRPIVGAKT